MEHYKVITAIFLLILTFVLKLVVGKEFGKIKWISAFIELPVTLLALSISFLFVYTLTCIDDTKNRFFVLCLPYIIAYIIVILLWRAIEKMIDKKNDSKVPKWGFLLCLNILLAFSGLSYSASLLFSKDEVKVENSQGTYSGKNENPDSIKTGSNVK